MSFSIAAYCARIGYRGGSDPTLETLAGLHRCHAQAIPFENLDPLGGVTPRLDVDGLADKLVSARRGGYCFEHNLLFRHVLEHLGFRVTALAGRVLWAAAPDVTPPRTHMLLQVDLAEGPFLADVGYGNLTLTAPLRFVTDDVQATPHESFRLMAAGPGLYRLEVRIGAAWRSMYQFDLQPQHLIDYEIANWYLSTNPGSRFVRELLAARVDGDRRYTLRNAELAVHHRDGRTERRRLASVPEIEDVLAGPLAIALPGHHGFARALARIAATG